MAAVKDRRSDSAMHCCTAAATSAGLGESASHRFTWDSGPEKLIQFPSTATGKPARLPLQLSAKRSRCGPAGNGNPSIETLWSLCVALDIPFARLLEPQAVKTQVIRRGEGTKVVAEQAHYQATLLATCPPGARRDIYFLDAQPGADRISQPHPSGSVEHIIVTRGRAMVGLTEAPEELNEGDYICYPADQPHIFKALEPDTQAILVSEQN